jgi:hypothetical protein
MKFVYVLEDDPKFQKEISEAISIVDPKIQIRLFPKLENFADWIRLMMTKGPAAIALGGVPPIFVPQLPVAEEAHQLVLVVSKVEFLGVKQLELLKKTRKLFVERNICTAEDPTALVLTAFDTPTFEIRELENRILNNVVVKPFDRLILTQHLQFAIDGRHPASKYTIANQKTTAVIEMLKDVDMEAISDIGIVTKSNRAIPLGSVAKYYSQTFLSERHRSLFAICRECVPHPDFPDQFRCSFTFFAADQTQISNIRKKTRHKDVKEFLYPWIPKKVPSKKSDMFHVVILDEEENSASGLSGQLEKHFNNVQITAFSSLGAFLSDLDPELAVQQKDSNLKALGGATSVTLSFDSSGSTYLNTESDKADLSTLFGLSLSELKVKGNWFAQSLLAEHREKYRKMIQTGQVPADSFLSLMVKESPYLVKIAKISKENDQLQVSLIEPSKEEHVDWLRRYSRLTKPVHLIIANHKLFGDGAMERWTFVKTQMEQKLKIAPQIFMTSIRDFTDAEERTLGTVIQDIFMKPVDRVYFLQKVRHFFPFISERAEKFQVPCVQQNEIIKVVTPIKVNELSEAGIVMEYYRPMSLGSFREMVLWQPYEIGAPELLATCNFVEESPGQKGVYNCHFVFFGISDHFLKHIRVWIRDNYVLSKEGQAS